MCSVIKVEMKVNFLTPYITVTILITSRETRTRVKLSFPLILLIILVGVLSDTRVNLCESCG